ncbi:MAG: hypothetical protein CMH27_00515 [Micavibrio sp.]|nr:hypothetical protein [Micavibrio sp.]|tara:strand:- start:839 stop:2041 length:1203 start_codon:yes stop_codon:yes gene_type:complete
MCPSFYGGPMANKNKIDVIEYDTGNKKESIWLRGAKQLGDASVNVLSGIFNASVLVGAGALYCANHGDGPLDGLNNIMTHANIQRMEENMGAYSARNYYREFLEQKQFTFYGDSNHTEGAIREYFFTAENTANIIDAGVAHVFIEYPVQLQYLVEGLQSGALQRDDFIRELSRHIHPLWWTDEQTQHYHGLMADMILTLNESNVQLHFSDPGMAKSGMKEDSKALLFEMAGVIVKEMEQNGVKEGMSPLEIFIATQKFVYTKVLADPDFEERLEALYEDFFAQRLGVDNERIAENIMAKAGDERAVILYGAAHIMRDHDLDEMLGVDKTQSVLLYNKKANYADFLMGALYSLYLPQHPQNIHIIDEAEIYTPKYFEPDAELASANIELAHLNMFTQAPAP